MKQPDYREHNEAIKKYCMTFLERKGKVVISEVLGLQDADGLVLFFKYSENKCKAFIQLNEAFLQAEVIPWVDGDPVLICSQTNPRNISGQVLRVAETNNLGKIFRLLKKDMQNV